MVGLIKRQLDHQNGIHENNTEDILNSIVDTPKRPNRRKEKRRKTREKAKINNNDNNNIQDRTEQRIFDICKERFGIIADPRFSITKNVNYLLDNYHPTDLPRQPNSLKVHNLCTNPTSISKDLLDTLGLNLNFGISLKPRKDEIPIDFERLRCSIRLKYVKFPIKKEIFISKLHSTSNWPPPNAPKKVETAIDNYETATAEAFQKSWKRPQIENLGKAKIDLSRNIKKERKYVVIASDKKFGSVYNRNKTVYKQMPYQSSQQ
jgi:hypothetical protein